MVQALLDAATWTTLTKGQFRRLNGVYLKCIHLAAGTAKEDSANPNVNTAAMVKTAMVPLQAFLRLIRLGFLPRLLAMAPPYLLQLMDESRTRRGMAVEDLKWLAQHTNKFENLPDPDVSIQPWMEFCRCHPGAWKDVLRQVRAAVVQGLTAMEAEAAPPLAPEPLAFHCYECGQAFSRLQAFKVHHRIVHGSRAQHWDAVHGTACLCCLREFHGVDRLLTHYRNKARCYDRIVRHVPADDASAALVEALRQQACDDRAQRRRGAPAIPFVQMPDPPPERAT